MMEIFKPVKNVFVSLDKPIKQCWINFSNPDEENIAFLGSLVDLPHDFIYSIKDIDELPFIEKDGDTFFFLIRIPVESEEDVPYKTVPMGVIFNKSFFITVCFHDNIVISRLKSLKAEFGIGLVIKLLYASSRTYLSYLKDINREIQDTEKDLEKTTKNEDLLELFELEKSLVFFSTSISNNRIIIERLKKLIKDKHSDLYDDMIQEYRQAAYTTKICNIVVTSTINTFGSIISNNLNKVVKRLTVITLILMLPTLVASFYGMNVILPFQHHEHAFLITIGVSLLFSSMTLYILRLKSLV